MPDASTAQLVTVAVISAVGGGGLAALTKWGEFRREDRARWLAERRDHYANVIDNVTEMLEAAYRAVSVDKHEREASVTEQATTIYEKYEASLGSAGVLRLLAPKPVVSELGSLTSGMRTLVTVTLGARSTGRLGDPEDVDATRKRLSEQLARFTDAARKDIRA